MPKVEENRARTIDPIESNFNFVANQYCFLQIYIENNQLFLLKISL